jgi:L-cysteine:1D-myo-inositol 2-amino-2-deoxy-alpha-D-glucopyranoside ligase
MSGMAFPPAVLFNTESGKPELLSETDVGLYVCGVTPYDTSHLGHAFTYTVFDVLVRWLRFCGHRVTYVQNVTDIDDDVLLRAERNREDWKELGIREYSAFRKQMEALGNLPPDVAPRATDHIAEMHVIIARLMDRGLAYTSGGSVYFDVAHGRRLGRLFKDDYDSLLHIANERGNFPADPLKRDPLDFILWQHQKPGEPAWDSPWGPGRPGWHIECSAMAMKYLGETVTIHGGGDDLIFPHHEAEIAQSEGVTGVQFVRHWIHVGMVYCGEHKMSKSLGNMVFVADLLMEHSADALRLYLLGHPYREPWNHPMGSDIPTCELSQHLCSTLADVPEADTDDVVRNGEAFLQRLADDLDTRGAIDELLRLADSQDIAARCSARTLATRVLGLTLSG